VRLTPEPPAIITMLLDFATVEDCAATVSEIIARGVVPAALEMMDQGIVRAVESFAHAGYPTDAAAVLLVEVDGIHAAAGAEARQVEAAARAHAVGSIRVAETPAERALLWKGRKSAFGAIAQIAPHYHLHDCVVPRTKLVEVLTGVYAICRRERITVTNVFHAGDGNLHPLLSFDRSEPGVLDRVLRASEEIVRLCVDAGGSLSGEHGIGLEKRDFMPLVFTEDDLAAQACVRSAFDPSGRMNPRKVLPDGARCGDFAVAAAGAVGAGAAEIGDAAQAGSAIPEGSWI
jgi:glycolate oxidase